MFRYFHPSWLVIFGCILVIINAVFSAQNIPFSSSEIELSGTIASDPVIENGMVKFSLKSKLGKIYVQVNTELSLRREDEIRLLGKVQEGFMYRPKIIEMKRAPNPFLDFRDWFIARVNQLLPEREAALSVGYLLGDKSNIDKEFLEKLRAVGLIHIIVASGAHLGIIVGLCRKIFGRISRFAGVVSALLLMVCFVMITGLSASMLRASIVTFLTLICWYYGRKWQAWRLLLIAAATTLLIDQGFVFELGWQLSFASFGGILVLNPIIEKYFYGKRKPGFVGSSLITSLSATMLCAPILLFNYGSFSLVAPIAGLLVMPTVSIVMGLTFLTGILQFEWLAWVDKIIIDYQILVVNFWHEQQYFLIKIEPNNYLIFLLYLLPCLIILGDFWKNKRCKIKNCCYNRSYINN